MRKKVPVELPESKTASLALGAKPLNWLKSGDEASAKLAIFPAIEPATCVPCPLTVSSVLSVKVMYCTILRCDKSAAVGGAGNVDEDDA